MNEQMIFFRYCCGCRYAFSLFLESEKRDCVQER